VYLFSLIDAIKSYPAIDQSVIGIVKVYFEIVANNESAMPICVKRVFLKVFRSLLTNKQKDAEFAYRVMCVVISCFEQDLLIGAAEKAFCRGCEENINIAGTIFT
jgi:hypothetical protein